MLTRRSFLVLTSLAMPCLLKAEPNRLDGLTEDFANLEKENGGRLGVAVIDIATGASIGHRADQRFPMCSTVKFLLATTVLYRVDHHKETLDHELAIPPKPLVPHSPATEAHAGGKMKVSELCDAILTQSDNTGANVLLKTLGGPSAFTAFARSMGDKVTRLDRYEPELNQSHDGELRDTTSPLAMAQNLKSILLGSLLSTQSREQLTKWMEANETGLTRLRAKLPQGWRAADKTGSDGEHTSNDIAVLWPEGKQPIIIAAYLTQCHGPETKRGAVLAEVARLVRQRVS